MIAIYIAGGSIALILLLFFLSVILDKDIQKKAPQRLERANQLYAKGEPHKAIKLLQSALYVPQDGLYDRDSAQTALRVLDLITTILFDMGIREVKEIDSLREELWKVSKQAVKISESLTAPVETLLNKLVFESGDNIHDIMKMVQKGTIEDNKEDSFDFTYRIPKEHQVSKNRVNGLLLRGKAEEAIKLLNLLIPTDNRDATATFLEQRASCNTMLGRFDKALEDYNLIKQLFPHHPRTADNIRDVEKSAIQS